jgi:hypothetical protein
MHKTSDRDVALRASESEQLAVRMLAEAYKRVPVGDRNWLPTCKIDCRQVLQAGLERGLHRRRGVKGRLHVARTVRVRARRVLGAAAVLGVVTVLCLASALGLTRAGNSGIPGYQKPENPFLHATVRKPDSGSGTARNHRPARSVSLGLGVPVPVETASVPSASPTSSASPSSSPSPTASASPSTSASPTASASPSTSASPTAPAGAPSANTPVA